MTVEERLARLECENRRLKVTGFLVIAIAASVFLMGQVSIPSEVTAQRFTLVNGAGVRIGELTPDSGGLPFLMLYEPGQTLPVVTMGLAPFAASGDQPRRVGGPLLDLAAAPAGSSSAARIQLTVVDGIPSVLLYDRNGKGRISLSIDGAPSISIWNEQLTRAVWQAP
jgi:hypothetical protein